VNWRTRRNRILLGFERRFSIPKTPVLSQFRTPRFEPLEDRRMLAPIEFHFLALIYPELHIPAINGKPAVDASMSQAAVDAVLDGVQAELPTLINQLAGDQVTARVHAEVIDRPLDRLAWSGTNYEYATDAMISEELDQLTRSGWYDHVMVIHGLIGVQFGPTAFWGGGGLARYGMSMASINVDPNAGKLARHVAPGMIHEWIHGLEVQYFDRQGVNRGLDPNGNALDLHDAELFGYTNGTDGRTDWSAWYGDFLTDDIRNLHSNGSDSNLGLGPDAWIRGPARQDVPYVIGDPLQFPDVSNSTPVFLSELYWAAASTEWDVVRRNRSVDDNVIRINGAQFQRGVGIHANGEIDLYLYGRADRFQSYIGVDDDVPIDAGSVIFKIFGDDRLLYQSGMMTGVTSAQFIDVSVLGVNQLRLVVEDGGNGNHSDHAVWADARFTPFAGDFLSNSRWTSSRTDWGHIYLDKTVDRNLIRINGQIYGKGVGIHAVGEIVVNLDRRYSRFMSDVGVDDDVSPSAGSIAFFVYGDNRLLYSSGTMTGANGARLVDLDVAGVDELRLFVSDAGNGINSDHGVWANARLTLPPPSADFNGDRLVDGSDFLAWQRGLGKGSGAQKSSGDADNDGDVDAADLGPWKASFGQDIALAAGDSAAANELIVVTAASFAPAVVVDDSRARLSAYFPDMAITARLSDSAAAPSSRRAAALFAKGDGIDGEDWQPARRRIRDHLYEARCTEGAVSAKQSSSESDPDWSTELTLVDSAFAGLVLR
jgi:hypothetical protein